MVIMAFDYASKIAALLAHAEDPATPDEARQTYRDKAAQLMKDYQIAEEEAIAVDPTSATPISRDIVIQSANVGQGDLSHWYAEVFRQICRHTGVRYHTHYDEDWSVVATVVGYEGDVRYTEYLWTAAYLMFCTRIDPVWDSSRTEAENIFLLRNSGVERRRIADMAWGNGTDAAARSKVQRIYVREAARRGEDARAAGLGFHTDTYRAGYADAFTTTLRRRLQMARDAADSVGGGLVLAGRADRVNEAFYVRFPSERPPADPAGPYVCADCTDTKPCKIHKPRKWTARDEADFQRRTNSASARAGQASGQRAAEGVDVQRGHTKAQRIDASGVAIEG
jgi:hypothetical protein